MNGKELKKICIPLYLAKETNSGSYEGEACLDNVERLRLVIDAECTDDTHFRLKGSDTKDGAFIPIPLIDAEGAENYTISFSGIEKKTAVIVQAHKYYKISVEGETERTFTAYLIETTFELPVTFKSLEFIFKDLQAEQNSNFEGKSEYYRDIYNDAMANVVYSYDENEDGIADETEINNTKTITLMR
jgi:hypothetical protein